MASVEDVLGAAEGELGYYAPDDPEPGSKYGRWMAEVTGEGWLRGPSSWNLSSSRPASKTNALHQREKLLGFMALPMSLQRTGYRADFTLYGDCNGDYYEYVR